MLVLKVVNHDMTPNYRNYEYPDFKYPMPDEDIGHGPGIVVCPDWDPYPECGHGLHGWLGGAGDPSCINPFLVNNKNSTWLVIETDSIVDLAGKVKFQKGKVLFVGSRQDALSFMDSKNELANFANWKKIINDDFLQCAGFCSSIQSSSHSTKFQFTSDNSILESKYSTYQIAENHCELNCTLGSIQSSKNFSKQKSDGFGIQIARVGGLQESKIYAKQICSDSSLQISESDSIQISENYSEQRSMDRSIQISKYFARQKSGYNSIQISEEGSLHKAKEGSLLISKDIDGNLQVAKIGYGDGELDPEKVWKYSSEEGWIEEIEADLDQIYWSGSPGTYDVNI